MYIERSIDKALLEWKERSSHKPLLLRGARQVGKSTEIRHLGEQFEYYIEANFEKNAALETLFTSNLKIDEIVSGIGSIYNTPIIPGKTLLFLDEVQLCLQALLHHHRLLRHLRCHHQLLGLVKLSAEVTLLR